MTIRASGARWLAVSLTATATARADLTEDVERLSAAWKTVGLEVAHRTPVFMEQGRVKRVPLTGVETSVASDECTTVAVLGVRGAEFALRPRGLDGASLVPERASKPERSLAGAASITRCGPQREELATAVVEMKSARGALEILVARGNTAAPPPADVLLERVVPMHRIPMDPGRALSRETTVARRARAEARARAEGAHAVTFESTRATEDGAGRFLVPLPEGCHRLELLGELGAEGRVADLDAELRDASTNAVLGRDRSDTPDARLDTCVGEPTAAVLAFAGAPPSAGVLLVSSRWLIPPGIPPTFGPRARGAIAMGLTRRRVPRQLGVPFFDSLGVSGTTILPVSIVPGRCYVASVATVRGDPRLTTLSTSLEARAYRDDGGPLRDGATIGFCSLRSERVTLQVESKGAGTAWALVVWDTGVSSIDEVAP
jgi:hypothetical protein